MEMYLKVSIKILKVNNSLVPFIFSHNYTLFHIINTNCQFSVQSLINAAVVKAVVIRGQCLLNEIQQVREFFLTVNFSHTYNSMPSKIQTLSFCWVKINCAKKKVFTKTFVEKHFFHLRYIFHVNYFSKPDSSPQTQDIRQEFNFTDSQFLRVFPGI